MNIRKTILGSTIAISALCAAAYADAAKAMDNGNPYLPTIVQSDGATPMKVSDPAYCSKEITHSCVGLDLINGEGPNKAGLPAREGKHVIHEVKKI
jgi:hypothetical protein